MPLNQKAHKVKITGKNKTKDNKHYWYFNCVGAVFRVIQDSDRDDTWVLVDRHDADKYINYRPDERRDLPLYIWKGHCKIVPDVKNPNKYARKRSIRCL